MVSRPGVLRPPSYIDEEILGDVQFKGTEQNIIFKGTGGGPSSTSPQATELAGGRGI